MSEPRGYIRYELVDFTGKALSKTIPARHKDKKAYMYSGMLAAGVRILLLLLWSRACALRCCSCCSCSCSCCAQPPALSLVLWQTLCSA